jgi:phosphatidylserine/phosphatidylglycerophosphate/cardiolipin synthase-like enzyme
MKPDEVDEVLLRTLDDERLSRGEKRALTAVFADYRGEPERLVYFRHRAFEVARRQLEGSGSRAARVLTWLEEVVKALAAAADPATTPKLAEAHFSPGDRCRRRIVSLIGSARRTADICVFTITDDVITRALLEAHHRGVEVRVISDDEKVTDRGSDIVELSEAGIAVRVDRSEHHMHHKFAIFDRTYLVTGSYNWTRSAASFNEENIVVSDDPRLLGSFQATFDRLWREFGGGAT